MPRRCSAGTGRGIACGLWWMGHRLWWMGHTPKAGGRKPIIREERSRQGDVMHQAADQGFWSQVAEPVRDMCVAIRGGAAVHATFGGATYMVDVEGTGRCVL